MNQIKKKEIETLAKEIEDYYFFLNDRNYSTSKIFKKIVEFLYDKLQQRKKK